jgi:hypothetical protein
MTATVIDDIDKNQIINLLIEALMHLEMTATDEKDTQEMVSRIWKAHRNIQSCWKMIAFGEPRQ